MEVTTVTPPEQRELKGIAPVWHTIVVLLVLFALSALGARTQSLSPFGPGLGKVLSYTFILAVEWLLAGFIWFGVRRRGVRIGELMGKSWPNWIAVLRDLGIALLFLLASNAILAGLGRLLRATTSQGVRNIVPNGRAEVVVYLLLALTAGICEEIIFRGYLQRQFAAMARSNAAGLVLQGIAFGAAHGYQGGKYILIIAVYGCLFGSLAYWRKNLRPGMIAHFLQDGISGLLARHFMR